MENKSAQARCVLGAAERRFVIRGGVEMKNRLKFARSRQTRQSKAMQCSPGLFLGGGRGGLASWTRWCARADGLCTHARTHNTVARFFDSGRRRAEQSAAGVSSWVWACGRVPVC